MGCLLYYIAWWVRETFEIGGLKLFWARLLPPYATVLPLTIATASANQSSLLKPYLNV